jgi:hypothetical protein
LRRGLQGTVHRQGLEELVGYAESWRDHEKEGTLRDAIEPHVRWCVLALAGAREAVEEALEESATADAVEDINTRGDRF